MLMKYIYICNSLESKKGGKKTGSVVIFKLHDDQIKC